MIKIQNDGEETREIYVEAPEEELQKFIAKKGQYIVFEGNVGIIHIL